MLDTTMRTATPGRSLEKGQALILFVLFMTVVFVIGVIVVDVSLWLTERRGAQKDADLATLAGAMELLQQDFVNPDNNNEAAVRADAEDAVHQWTDYNDLPWPDVHGLEIGRTGCLGPSPVIDTVRLDAEHHGGRLFMSIIDDTFIPQIGASAKACIGSIVTAEGLLPVGIQISGVQSDCWADVDDPPDGQEDPLFGQECVLTVGAGDQISGEAGNLSLLNDGSLGCTDQSGGLSTWRTEVENGGANTECHVYRYFSDASKTCDDDPGGCVYSQPGTGGGASRLGAWEDLISSEGDCDAAFGDGDGIDEFLEVVEAVNGDTTPSPDTVFSKRDCVSPRLVSLVIVRQFTGGPSDAMPIEAFAGFYITGCTNDDGTIFSAKCQRSALPGGAGNVWLKGFFVNILVTSGDVGGISKWSPKQVVLVE